MATQNPPTQLVVVGSSAGGIEALSTLLSSLPRDFPAPIVIAQHLDPQRPSHLGEILASRSSLPVQTILDHDTLTNGHVYVVPADWHVEIADGHITLRNDKTSRGPKPSINLLFTSAAEAFGEGLIAVILTGSGSDGAAGALEVKKAGGTVVIQNPATAPYPSMPQSLAPTVVDLVANVEEIGELLYALTSGAALTLPNEAKALREFLTHVHDHSGLDFTSYKPATVLRRLKRRMVATGTESLTDYVRYLQSHPEEYQRLISAFLIKVTEFFRDKELFDTLREQVMPEILTEARRRNNEVRIWSAGCATGEEAYSLAILVAELLAKDLEQYSVRIFATDLDEEAINFARRGVYPAASLVNLDPELIRRHFTKVNGAYEVHNRVRSLVVFGQHDLGQRAPFPRTDLVLCRNVLIYFNINLQKHVLQLFAYSLRDRGYLVLGKAESISPFAEYFAPVPPPNLRIYRRHGERQPIPTGQLKVPEPIHPPPRVPRPTFHLAPDLLRPQEGGQRARTSTERLGDLMLNLPIGVIVVDRRYDIQIINAAALQLLDIHRAAVGEDLLHLVEGVPTKPLRDLIDGTFRGESPPDQAVVLPMETESNEQRHLRVQVFPKPTEGAQRLVDNVLLLVSDVTASVREQEALEHQRAQAQQTNVTSLAHERDSAAQRVTQQQQEIDQLKAQLDRIALSNREVREANQELTATNLELRQMNEEFVVTTEELQAASEEVETLNEELQATNEELETLNEELQATNEELNTSNDDLQARSLDLQSLALRMEDQQRVSETERARLQTILVSMGDAVLVVDTSGNPLLTNASYDTMFGGPNASLALEDGEGHTLQPEFRPDQRAARGESFIMVFTLHSPKGLPRWFEATGAPFGRGDSVQGGVVIIRDITDRSLRRVQDEFLAQASHELLTPLSPLQAALQELLQPGSSETALAELAERTQRYGTAALHQAQRLTTLVNELVDVERLQTGQLHLHFQPVELTALARRTAEAMQPMAAGQRLVVSAPKAPIYVRGDALRLEQALMNLLDNAIKFAPGTERIDLRLKHSNDTVELQVQDYGPGIAPADVPRLFSRFIQLAGGDRSGRSGLGLGLYITRELIAAHGGTVNASSQVGRGTTFTVQLPMLPRQQAEAGNR